MADSGGMRRVALSGGDMAHFIGPGMHTTDRVNEPVTTGRPLREGYRRAAKALANPAGLLSGRTAAGRMAARVSPGGCGHLEQGRVQERLETLAPQ